MRALFVTGTISHLTFDPAFEDPHAVTPQHAARLTRNALSIVILLLSVAAIAVLLAGQVATSTFSKTCRIRSTTTSPPTKYIGARACEPPPLAPPNPRAVTHTAHAPPALVATAHRTHLHSKGRALHLAGTRPALTPSALWPQALGRVLLTWRLRGGR